MWIDDLCQSLKWLDANEIFLNGPQKTFYIKDGIYHELKSYFTCKKKMTEVIQIFSFEQNIRLDPLHPFAGGTFKNNAYRWQAVIEPACFDGPFFCLRRHRFDNLKTNDFEISEDLLGNLKKDLIKGDHLIICGPCGSGKTSFLCALLKELCKHMRVAIIEDYEELPVFFPLWCKMKTKVEGIEHGKEISFKILINESLRLHPDKIVIGEVRGDDILFFFQSLFTGQVGGMTTLHVNSVDELKRKLKNICDVHSFDLNYLYQSGKILCLFLERGNPPKVTSLERL